jgi:hypothetical protein
MEITIFNEHLRPYSNSRVSLKEKKNREKEMKEVVIQNCFLIHYPIASL